MSDLTQEQLSEQIALKHEARPTLEDTAIYLRDRLRKHPHNGWWELARHSGKPVEDINSYYWRPAMSYDSPQCAMRLLKELLAMKDWQVLIGDCDEHDDCVEFELTTTEEGFKRGLRGFVQRWPIEQIADGIAISWLRANE